MADIKRMFTPEFRNRLDATISFRALDEEIILRVVDKFLMQLEEQLHEKKVEAIFTEKPRKFLAKKGFDPLMGARPMARLIQDMIRRRWPTSCCSASCSTAARRKAGSPLAVPLHRRAPPPRCGHLDRRGRHRPHPAREDLRAGSDAHRRAHRGRRS